MRWFKYILLGAFFITLLGACGGPPPEPGMAPEPVSGIAFTTERDGDLNIYLMQPDGSGITRLTDDPEVDMHPTWSPDGRQIAFRSQRDGSSDIFIMGADGSDPVNILGDAVDSIDDEFAPVWSPNGDYFALYSDRFNPAGNCGGYFTLFHRGSIVPVSGDKDEIRPLGNIPGDQMTLTWTPDGRFVTFGSVCSGDVSHLHNWEQATGEVTQITDGPYRDFHPAWSPDGRYLAFTSNRDGYSDIFVLDTLTEEITNLTFNPRRDTEPTWSPDGSQIAFTSERDGDKEIYVMNADGSDLYNLTNNPADDYTPEWSPIP